MDEPGLLRDRNEHSRRDFQTGGVDQAGQRFESGQGAGTGIEQRLIRGRQQWRALPRRMTRSVVDPLEAVEVAEQHGDLAPVASRPGQGSVEAVDEQRPVRQAGEVVVQRRVGELFLSFVRAVLQRRDSR